MNKEQDSRVRALEEQVRLLREALQFYSTGQHVEVLYGKRDWVKDRKDLEDRGFRREGREGHDGEETFVEQGGMAQAALDATAE